MRPHYTFAAWTLATVSVCAFEKEVGYGELHPQFQKHTILGLGGPPPDAFLVYQAPKQGDIQEFVRTGHLAYFLFC